MTIAIDIDRVAAEIHGYYDRKYSSGLPTQFKDLSEAMKVDNREAALRIEAVLAQAGLRVVPREGQPWTDVEQKEMSNLIEQNIDLLAEAEHDGWMEARLRHGWQVGPSKDPDARMSHLLVPYAKLAAQVARKQKHAGAQKRKDGTPMSVDDEVEYEKDKDRNSVLAFVPIIAQTEYRIALEGNA